MIKNNKLLKTLLLSIFLILVNLLIMQNKVYAEGSKELVDAAPEQSYRAHLEWQSGNTLGIPRKSILKVYAKEGEIINFGGSVFDSYDSNDIVVHYPDGTSRYFDVESTGKGYIDTVEKEKNGPFPDNRGYIPLQINVTQTGIYSFEFHGEIYTQGADANPKDVTVIENFTESQAATVSAWDITVTKDENEILGRVYSDYLSLNVGKNITGINFLSTHFYILTKDGYLYRTSLDNVDPFGFLIFSNNEGLINGNTGEALYHSARSTNNEFTELIGNVKVPQPQHGDTHNDKLHRIFYNIPAEDLPEEIVKQAIPPAKATNFKFIGIENNITKENQGGYFSFDIDGETTYEIEIVTSTGARMIGETTVIGNNKVYWDGLDVDGNVVPEGKYNAMLKIKGGEYHFPFFDVENSYGLTIQLLNPPYTYEGFNPYMIYYDNSNYTIGNTYVDLMGPGITSPIEANVRGIDSSPIDSFTFTNNYGNEKAIDVWTYFNSESIETDLTVIKEDESGLTGFVFNDVNRDGIYEPERGDKPFSNVEVQITDTLTGETKTIYTDENGIYSEIVQYGEYEIEIITPENYETTTNNLIQNIIADRDIAVATNVGFSNTEEIIANTVIIILILIIIWYLRCSCKSDCCGCSDTTKTIK